MRTIARRIDKFLTALVVTVILATVVPAHGQAAPLVSRAVLAAIALLFFLYGARLSRSAMVEGLSHWRLQALVLAGTYVLFPLIGLAISAALRPVLPADLRVGIQFLCLLPSTVQSSIAFTAIGRGNVAAALCSASVSNVLGVLLTPALVVLIAGGHGFGLDPRKLVEIASQLLLPFMLGQAVRPWLGPVLERHRALLSAVDRGSILLVVYAAFSEGVTAGLWRQVSVGDLLIVLAADAVVLGLVLAAMTALCRVLGFSRADEVAIVFCGSKKSMASGIPMAEILVSGSGTAPVVLPLMLFHQLQLFACAALARRYAARDDVSEDAYRAIRADLGARADAPAIRRSGPLLHRST